MPKLKRSRLIPRFESEASERQFWETHDTAGLVDWSGATAAVFPNLKPSTETISLRLPAGLLADLRVLANKRDVPYQSLLKVFLAERVARERIEQRAVMPKRRLQPTKPQSRKQPPGRSRGRLRG